MSGSELALFGKIFVAIAGAFAQVATAANDNVFGVIVAVVVLLGCYLLYVKGRTRRQYGRKSSGKSRPAQKSVYRPPARLRVLNGPFKGEVAVFDDCVLLGRDPSDAQLSFPSDPKVSRAHCAVRFEPSQKQFRVKDLGSMNHTLLVRRNGARIWLPPFIERGASPGDRLVLASRHEVLLELAR
ncbi:MAG: FHA domain-containing protein [Alphaproteobacteria bacterium]|nr:FHA domain-containing protein [Alphaproteobacteria bacterium]